MSLNVLIYKMKLIITVLGSGMMARLLRLGVLQGGEIQPMPAGLESHGVLPGVEGSGAAR